jgi:hypothetical protein
MVGSLFPGNRDENAHKSGESDNKA